VPMSGCASRRLDSDVVPALVVPITNGAETGEGVVT
jgi:hypothetical protein